MSRTLSFFPLTATTKSSISCFFTPFMRINCRNVYMYAYTGKLPLNIFSRTFSLISPISPRRTLTHDLLRDNSAAISPTLLL